MKNIRPFQLVLMVGFGVIALLGLFVFSSYKSSSSSEKLPVGDGIVIWGTLPEKAFKTTFALLAENDDNFKNVSYVQKDADSFDLDLLQAAAEGVSPDLVAMPSEYLVSWIPRLYALPYEQFPERTFLDAYVDGTTIFMRPDGVYGFPFAVDPLVLYWNKDLFATAGFSTPPTTYEALLQQYVAPLTRIDGNNQIQQSAIALGLAANILYAKDILSMLILQTGNTIVEQDAEGYYTVTLGRELNSAQRSSILATEFYTQFANPTSGYYTWNNTFTSAEDAFIGNKLAMMFAYASEVDAIGARNPNLNFDVTSVPQNASDTIARSFGRFYAFAIPRGAQNISGSIYVAQVLSGAIAASLDESLSLAPVLRGAIADGVDDARAVIGYRAALSARTWLDPEPVKTSTIFGNMIRNITNGTARVGEAVRDTAARIEQLLLQN